MISIITPVYNAEPNLQACIDSVQNQDYKDWEWILVDDGSTDGGPAILADLASKDERVKVITQKNGGPALARNRALDEIRGEYVTFIDSDDWMEQGALSRIQEICETEKPDMILWTYTRFENGQYIASKLPLPKAGMHDEEALHQYELDLIFRMGKQQRQYAPFLWARAIKASLIRENNIRFNTNLRRSEDTLFSIIVQRYCKKMYVFSEPFIVYRVNPTSISHSYVENYMQGMDQIYEDIISYAQKTSQQEMEQRAYYMYIYRTLFAIQEEINYKSFSKALGAMRMIMKSPHLQESLQGIGEKGTATFGRRYSFLYRRQVLPLYYLMKTR